MTRTQMTPAQCGAARALVDMTGAQLAGSAIVPRVIIEEFEAGGIVPSEGNIAVARRALEQAGVIVIERDSLGLGRVEEMTKACSIAGCTPARLRDFHDIVLRPTGR